MKCVVSAIPALLLAILAAPTLHMNLLGAMRILVFGFLFATVSSRLTGEIGSSSNPISGMTVATLLARVGREAFLRANNTEAPLPIRRDSREND
jgi:uncharacterized oligopeptide transporter (OPT) family protein